MATSEKKTAVKVVLGTASYGYGLTVGASCNADKVEIQKTLDLFKNYGCFELDTARVYSEGTSEAILAEIDYAGQGMILDTKITGREGNHTADKVHASVAASLAALKTTKVHIMYLHHPDRATPLEETLNAVNEEFLKGRFEKFGISNYTTDEVEKIIQITTEKGWVKPSVYQGLYNLLARANEEPLFPVLRKHNISFYAYSPLAGSFLVGNVPRSLDEVEKGSRFDKDIKLGTVYIGRFHKDIFFEAIDKLNEVGKPHGLAILEIALRWIVHHSQLSSQFGDAIVTGGKRFEYMQTSLDYFARGPLPTEVVEEVWSTVKAEAPSYHM